MRTLISTSILAVLLCCVSVSGCGAPDPVLPPPPSIDLSEAATRGHYLANGLGACGFCHSVDGRVGADLSGGRLVRDIYGEVTGPNITRAESGVGLWTESDLKKALRSNLRPDGSEMSSRVHRGFGWLADSDISAITTYLRGLPPVEKQIESRRLSFVDRNTTGLFESRLEVKGYIPAINPQFKAEYGQYLTDSVARCGSCHTKPEGWFSSEEYLAGGAEVSFDGEYKLAPNITMSTSAGIGSWSEGALLDFLRSGRTPAGREVDSRFCPVQFYARAPLEQLQAIVAYLRTVPAVN
jgi:mono/diheme cytochrome c family protein